MHLPGPTFHLLRPRRFCSWVLKHKVLQSQLGKESGCMLLTVDCRFLQPLSALYNQCHVMTKQTHIPGHPCLPSFGEVTGFDHIHGQLEVSEAANN